MVGHQVAVIAVRGLEMQQDVYVGRNTSLPGTTAQNAFWEFLTDPANPVMQGLTNQGFQSILTDPEPILA